MAHPLESTCELLTKQLESYSKQLVDADRKLMEAVTAVKNEDVIYGFAVGFGAELVRAAPQDRPALIAQFPRLLQLEHNRKLAVVLRSVLADRDEKAWRCAAIELAIKSLPGVDLNSLWSGLHGQTQKNMLRMASV